jgi:hypothetical protein
MPEYEEDPGCRYFSSSYAWNWGPQELAYDYVPAASTPVNLFLVWWQWRQGELLQLPKKEVIAVTNFVICRGYKTTVA